MRRMKPHLMSPPDRDELSRLAIDATDAIGIHRIVAKVSMLPPQAPQAIYEVERLIGCLPHVFPRRESWSRFRPSTNRAVEIDPAHASAFMFNYNRSGCVREAALKAVNHLPDTPFFLAALVWRLNG
jgi:hypothetical protein